ncbi:MAG: prolyl oligopeptidase [Acidobacteria bacterium]|jgi:dipeptidyl aminopeptidase/acylaminoacyl peptidase|nr:prolyl oligopeptidase [Acidobacteriota bacterium]MDP7691183.1 prolyl oligopeptidase family serine peptidase [Vicinamibacterales bacterium]HJN42917.1 prolyl oligopeptidase family serine peptidase [Vicinamibacterales bacterium]|tara:strand:- start:1896 stop:4328 length:2433 start_codon:yes stop_codon:yes gene_type:complete
MRRTHLPAVVLVAAALSGALMTGSPAVAQEATGYLTPPQDIVDILDAPRSPQVVVSPKGDTVALLSRPAMPSIAELAEPMLRLAGYRLNPRTNGPHTAAGITRITLKRISDGEEQAFDAPRETSLGRVEFSPDGSRLIFTLTRYNGIEVWMMETATGAARPLSDASINAAWGDPCDWLDENATVVCTFKASARGAPATAPDVPAAPNIQEHLGSAAPIRTYQDLLQNAHDEALFEYYFTSQVATIEIATGRRTPIGRPGLYQQVSASPSGQYFLIVEVERPFSWLVTARSFPKDVTIRNGSGEIVAQVARLPLADAVPIGGVPTGPRSYVWNPTEPHTLVWVEAQDGGDPRRSVPHRDQVFSHMAPFNGEPNELALTEFRYGGITWTEDGTALLTENDRPSRWTRTWVLAAGAEPRRLWDRSSEDRYANPGGPITAPRPGGRVIRQTGNAIHLTGTGASPNGDRPFLDRLDLRSFETERLFQSADDAYEVVAAVLSDDGRSVLTRRETRVEPPNYYVRDTAGGSIRTITSFPDPAPQLTGISKELVTYERADGVQLSGTLYMPPGYREGERVPMVMWAYPREFVDPQLAGQVTGSDNRFTAIRGASHLLLLTQGFAIFDGPTMPIVGKGETANDTYLEQLVASAQAAVDKVVDMGVTDRDTIGVGGHSYGAFMTANLLAHSDLFQMGIARSGAYNRSLTPFGFQNERRTFWEATDIYAAMSPFFHADKINEPILLTHGEADNNSGTFPIQSARMYMALKGHGATVRYVTLPHESHGYAARESVLHTVAEMLNWANTYVKKTGNPSEHEEQ